ncbi:MAG: HDOD domain-containing protein [Helicobacteraceae bacterium]|jgi:HD-like signal output (HDOD) protein|nr:HDOD domain-containing protein [Helicobacteraceae bacterium]
MLNDALYAHIKSLPPLPQSVVKIQRICSDPSSSVSDLTKVIELDPMLTANILKAANSPLYGFSRAIKTLAQAVSLFGMSTVRGFALAGAIKSTIPINMSPYRISPERFADLSLIQNALMVRWYSQVSRHMLEVLSPSAFLSGVGRLIISQEIIKSGKTELFISKSVTNGLAAAEMELFGVTYQEVSSSVFSHWLFEPEMVEAIGGSVNPSSVSPSMSPYAFALKVVQTAVEIPNGVSEQSVLDAAEAVASGGGAKEVFLKAANGFVK